MDRREDESRFERGSTVISKLAPEDGTQNLSQEAPTTGKACSLSLADQQRHATIAMIEKAKKDALCGH